MQTSKRIEVTNPAPGVYLSVEHIEWTPERSLDPHTRLPSTWRQPIGKKLTNAVILKRAAEGWYGPEWKNRVLASKKLRSVTASGMAIKCACGKIDGVRYYRFSYLPKAGYYCETCLALHRSERDKEKEQHARWRELFMKEFV